MIQWHGMFSSEEPPYDSVLPITLKTYFGLLFFKQTNFTDMPFLLAAGVSCLSEPTSQKNSLLPAVPP